MRFYVLPLFFLATACANLEIAGENDPLKLSSKPSPEEARSVPRQRCLINGDKADCYAWLSIASDDEISNEPIMFLEKLCPDYGSRLCIILGNKNVEIGYFVDAKKAFDLGCNLKSKDACKKSYATKELAKSQAILERAEKECAAGTPSACRSAYRLKYRVDQKAALRFLDLACSNEDLESCRILAKESIKSEDQEAVLRAFKVLCAKNVPQACSNYFELVKISEQKAENENAQGYREAILEQNRRAEKRALQAEEEARTEKLLESFKEMFKVKPKNRRKCRANAYDHSVVCEDVD
jgi:hypothetical protein